MEFCGLDETFYEEKMEIKISLEKRFKRNCVGFVGLIIFMIVGFLSYYVVPVTKNNFFILVLAVLSYPAILWMGGCVYVSRKDLKPFLNLTKLYHKSDQIIVFPDFHMAIKSYTGNYIDMTHVHNVRKNTIFDFLTVEYAYGNSGSNTYDISYGMSDFTTIETLLRFKMELQKSSKFVNDSMKKVFQMEPSLRNRLFVEELNSGELLMPIRLAEKAEYNERCILLFDDIYAMYEVDEQGYICLYTSMKEMRKQTHQEYSQSVHVSVKQLYTLLTQNYSSIFNASNTDFFITINRHNEKVNVSRAQLSKMLVLEQQDQVSQLYVI